MKVGKYRTKGIIYYKLKNVRNGFMQRCYNPNNSKYKVNGARGVRVCDRWVKSLSNFLEDAD